MWRPTANVTDNSTGTNREHTIIQQEDKWSIHDRISRAGGSAIGRPR